MNFICSEVENMSISINYYEFIKQMYENLTKYIKAYKSETNDYYKKISKLHEKYYPKLSCINEELKKSINIKTNHIISLSSKVPKIIGQQILNLKYFITGIDSTIKSFDKTLKEKNLMSNQYQNEYDDCRNSLSKKYKEIEKSKNIFFSNVSQTENLIYKYYLSKSSNRDISSSTSESSSTINEIQMENNIKQAKKYENDYLNLIKSAKPFEDKFFELSDNSKDNMKRLACEIITKMKDNIVDFLLLLKNCFKLPLSEIDLYLPELIKLDENKKIESIINSTYKKGHNLMPIVSEKYNINLIQNNNGDEEENNNIIEDEILNTIKIMEDNFELIDKKSIEQIFNPKKLRCRELSLKLLSFSPNILKEINKDNFKKEKNEENKSENSINKDNNNNENDKQNEISITKEEKEELSKLIEDKGNRAIFLRKIHSFRKYGEFEIPEKEFSFICDLFNKIEEIIIKEHDYDSMESIIILSQTFYKLENDNKIYIQKIIKNNQLFKEKEFWDEYVNATILKEVQKHINNDIKDSKFVDSQKVMQNEKYEKIVFAQLLPLLKNMIDFELDDSIIKSIIQTLISYYKLSPDSSKTLNDMIKYKGIKEETKQKLKDLNLSVIIENNNEDNKNMKENLKSNDKNINKINTEDKNEEDNKNEEEKEELEDVDIEEDDDEEKINKDLIENVNQTLADEEEDEDINNKLIKNLDDDEIDDELDSQIVKDEENDKKVNTGEKEEKNQEKVEKDQKKIN